jgi:hypothetical protein
MKDFDHILNWKLLGGSHVFPGTDGGTCINEAAIVAAGFAYQPLEGALDIGRQADPIALPDVEERMSVAKEEGSAAKSKGDKPLLATVKHLLDAMAL